MPRIWEIFPEVAERIREKHEEVGLFGHHDWPHAKRVGGVAYMVAYAEWHSYRIARCAGLGSTLRRTWWYGP